MSDRKMKDGCPVKHKHRYVHVTRGSLADKIMRTVVWTTCDPVVAERSKYPYRPMAYHVPGLNVVGFEFTLTVTSVLHRWFGVVRVDRG